MNQTQVESVGAADIAIVGMAARFPGAASVAEYWQNLRDGVESIRPLSDAELMSASVTSEALRDRRYVKAAGPLDDVTGFDAAFFGFSPKDAAILDPQHRHFYECAWAALEQAGHTSGGLQHAVGVFAGCGPNLYFMQNVLANPALERSVGFFLLRHTGNDRDFLPTGLSYKLNLQGPSVAVQTACSTSLVAIHMACQSLLQGECDLALAGGVSIYFPHGQGYYYRENEILSPDGHCRPFDADAAGTVITNGCGVVALRRAEDAIADRDFVHAIIKGSAVNNDGANKVGFLAPSVEGHADAVSEALALADVAPDDISYVETHGTGTAVGDPIEIAALTRAFRISSSRNQFCAIGSAKSNIGHTDTAAGVAGLIKVVEALKHRQIPPSVNFRTANPHIDFETSPFFVNAELRDWEPSGRRRAGVSSLGVGGTNAHAILEESPPQATSPPAEPWQPLLLSAKSSSALDTMAANLGAHLAAHPQINLADVSHTLQVGREEFAHRLSLVAEDVADAAQALESNDRQRLRRAQIASPEPSLVFMFPGGGAQYPNMGRDLYNTEAVYRQSIDRCFELLEPEVDFDLKSLMFPAARHASAAATALREVGPSICAIFATEYATAQLLASWNVTPAVMIGHSLGEYAAACLAGVMTLPDALRIVALRGRLLSATAGASMLSVPLPEAEVQELLGDDLDLAALNAPALCLVSGEDESLERLEQELAPRQVECRRLHLAAASHCRLLDPILDEFRDGLRSVELSPPQQRYISNVTGTWVRPEDACDPEYWVRHLRQRVRFAAGIDELLKDPNRALIEVGPGRTLSSLARQQSKRAVKVVSTLPHPDEKTNDVHHVRAALAELWTAGVAIDWQRLRGDQPRCRLPLPTYPFEHQQYWLPPVAPNQRQAQPAPLDKTARIEDWFYVADWQECPLTGDAESGDAAPGTTVIFLDEVGIGARLAELLRSQGESVITVCEGDAFYQFNDNEFALAAEEGLAGYQQLLSHLADADRLPTQVFHLWLVTQNRAFRPGSSFFHRNQERGLYSLVFLAQALGGHEIKHNVAINMVSTGLQAVGDERTADPEKATVLGPVRVIPTEMPGVITRSVDIQVTTASGTDQHRDEIAALAERLLAEQRAGQDDRVIAWRGRRRLVETFTKRELAHQSAATDRLQPRGVYWITGGLGGIGLEVAGHLARHYQARVALIGRTKLPPRDKWDDWLSRHVAHDRVSTTIRAIRQMEAHGAEVLTFAADVANIKDMQQVLAATRDAFGSVDGIFHVAGVLDDGILQTRTAESVDRVLTPKVHGTLLLADLLAEENLDFLALFSSTSALIGLPGQSDYTAANCFLNAFARSDRARRLNAVAINWGVWKELGMGHRAAKRIDSGERDEPTARQRTGHPWLDECTTRLPQETVFATRLSPQDQWLLDEHRTRTGLSILPGTGYLEFASAAYAESNGHESFEIDDLAIVAPLAVADDTTCDLRTHLSNSGPGLHLAIESQRHGEWHVHATGTLSPLSTDVPPQIDLPLIRRRCCDAAAIDNGLPTTRQMQQLRFGSRWRVVRNAWFGDGEAFAELALAEAYADDIQHVRLHPALLDLACGFALPLVEGDGEDGLYVPMSYQHVRVYDRLPSQVYSHVRLRHDSGQEDVALFDVTITDELGNVLLEIDQFAMRCIPDSRAFGQLPANLGAATMPQRTRAEELFLETYELGIEPAEGMEALAKIFATSPTPSQIIATSIELDALRQRLSALRETDDSEHVKFERPELSSEFAAPQSDLEQQLSTIWEELLGVDRVGIHDDFFELGGHSLIAVRLFAKIKGNWGAEFPISALFAAPTVASCAEMIRDELGDDVAGGVSADSRAPRPPKFRHLVPMNQADSSEHAPFFLVAGMFGNVLNLRHLAGHLGDDQPVYALQARGLHGDDAPHTRFEEMARDYLEEMRRISPCGPYFLGGFSGGGITAFEMAQQLRAAGEKVGLLVLLDAFPPPGVVPQPTWSDRLNIQWQRLRQRGSKYVWEWAINRMRWEMRRFRREDDAPLTPAEFRSRDIHVGFLEALEHYTPTTYSGSLHLFRPQLQQTYKLGPAKYASDERGILDEQNHWAAYVDGEIHVHEVTGDHDAMVLEPHVRVLAKELKACLLTAQQKYRTDSGSDQ